MTSAWTQVQEVQAPVQLKKDKKKARTDVKPVQLIITDDGKEPDEGLTLHSTVELSFKQTS